MNQINMLYVRSMLLATMIVLFVSALGLTLLSTTGIPMLDLFSAVSYAAFGVIVIGLQIMLFCHYSGTVEAAKFTPLGFFFFLVGIYLLFDSIQDSLFQ